MLPFASLLIELDARHYHLELAKVFGGGTMSSSDGQRFPVRGKTLTGRTTVIHGGQVLPTYTHDFFGVINIDVEAELAKLDTSGWRPLRPAQLRELGLTP
ncbi:Tn3 family transposase [Nonomuraea sp. NPDC005983]|uniref:Tn3 family transposase n=1 Tax=Nonomuraea sp. NPDC005983 TaxID=3155595 RepID=UPI0033B8E117